MPDKQARFQVLIEYIQQGDPTQIEQGLKRVQDAAKQAGETTGGIAPNVDKLEQSQRKLAGTSKELEGSLRSASDATYLFGMGAMYTGVPMLNFVANAGNVLNGSLMMAEGFGKLATNVPVLALSATAIAVTGLATAMIATANVADNLISKFRTLAAVSGQSTSTTASMINTLSGAMGQQGATSYLSALSGGTMTANPQSMMMEMARQGQGYNPFMPDVFARYGLSRFAAGSTPMNPIPVNQSQFTTSLMTSMLAANRTRQGQMLSQLGPQLGGTENLTNMLHYFQQGQSHGLTTSQIMAQLQAQGRFGFTPSQQGINAQQNLMNAQHRFGIAGSGFVGGIGQSTLPFMSGMYGFGADILSGNISPFMGGYSPLTSMNPMLTMAMMFATMMGGMGNGGIGNGSNGFFGGIGNGINGIGGGIFNFLGGIGNGAISAISGMTGATSGTNGSLTSPLGMLSNLAVGGNGNTNQSLNTFSQSTIPNLQNTLNTINPILMQFWQTFQNLGPTIDRVGNSAIQDQNPIIGIAAAFSSLLTGLTGVDFAGWEKTIGQWGSSLVGDFNSAKATVTDFVQNSIDPLLAAAGQKINIVVSAAVNWVSQSAQDAWKWLQNVPANVSTNVNLGLGWIGNEAQKVITWLEGVPGTVSTNVNVGLGWIGNQAQKVITWIEGIPGPVSTNVNTGLTWADGIANSVINWLMGIPGTISTTVSPGLAWADNTAASVINWLMGIPATVSTTVSPGLAWLSGEANTVINWLINIPGSVSTNVNLGLAWVGDQASPVINWIMNIPRSITTDVHLGLGWVGNMASSVIGWVMNIPASVLSTVNLGLGWLESTGESIVNWVMGLPKTLGATVNIVLTGIVGEVQNILNFLMGLPGTLGLNLNITGPSIPGFATGGIVMGPQLATVGEAGPEAIIPLSQMGSMGGHTFNISVQGMDFSDPVFVQNAAQSIGNQIVQNMRVMTGSPRVV